MDMTLRLNVAYKSLFAAIESEKVSRTAHKSKFSPEMASASLTLTEISQWTLQRNPLQMCLLDLWHRYRRATSRQCPSQDQNQVHDSKGQIPPSNKRSAGSGQSASRKQSVEPNQQPSDVHKTGPARFITRQDDSQEHTVLLLNHEILALLPKMVRNQRRYAREERCAKMQTKLIRKLEDMLRREIKNRNSRLNGSIRGDSFDKDHDQSRTAPIEEDLAVLHRMRTKMSNRKAEIEQRLRFQEEISMQTQNELSAILEEALISAGLLDADEKEEMPPQDFDMQADFQKTLDELNGPEGEIRGGYSPEPLELISHDETMQQPSQELSAEEQNKQATEAALTQALRDLDEARFQFDNKETHRDRDWHESCQAELRGEPEVYSSQTDFDLHWVQNFSDITRNLIDAEQAVKQAKRAAREAGVDVASDEQSSDFADDFDLVGYPLSQEIDSEEAQEHVMPLVGDWLDTVSERFGSGSENNMEVDLDEWDYEEVEIGDSLSCIDLDWHREKIDRWRTMCANVESQ